MYRTASYFKSGSFETLQVNVYEDSKCEMIVLMLAVYLHNSLVSSYSISPRTYIGHSLNVQFDELRRLHNYLDERNWKGRCKDYNLIVSSVL